MTVKDDLRALIDELEDDAAELLAYARWLLAEDQILTQEDLPAMWRRVGEPARKM